MSGFESDRHTLCDIQYAVDAAWRAIQKAAPRMNEELAVQVT